MLSNILLIDYFIVRNCVITHKKCYLNFLVKEKSLVNRQFPSDFEWCAECIVSTSQILFAIYIRTLSDWHHVWPVYWYWPLVFERGGTKKSAWRCWYNARTSYCHWHFINKYNGTTVHAGLNRSLAIFVCNHVDTKCCAFFLFAILCGNAKISIYKP